MRFNLIAFPSLIIVFIPIFLGEIQNFDVLVAPFLVLALSIIPLIILNPDFRSPVYNMSLLYFVLQAALVYRAMDYFSGGALLVMKSIPLFHFYILLGYLSVFVFINLVIHYYLRRNMAYEQELNDKNDLLNQNIQELKSAQNQLIQAEKMASLGILTAGVAHEINNPLNFIKGGFLGLKDRLSGEINKQKEIEFLFKSIEEGVERTHAIVKSLNQFSRQISSYDEEVDIHEILDNCLLMLQNKSKGRINIVKSYTKKPYRLSGNSGNLHQVFTNTIFNAIQSIENKGTITINTQIIQSQMVVKIKDTGCGISDDLLNRITDPFFTTKEPGQGTGLGLTISQNIVNEHNGNMEFTSEPGHGTLCSVSLPLNKSA